MIMLSYLKYYVCVYLNAFVAFSVLLRYCQYVLTTSHLCPGRIVFRCIYFVYFALVVWLDMQVIISDCFFLHVRMNIYLLYVHWSHSLMIALVWSSFVYTCYQMFTNLVTLYLLLYMPYVQLVIRFNESFVCVRVFLISGINVQVLHIF